MGRSSANTARQRPPRRSLPTLVAMMGALALAAASAGCERFDPDYTGNPAGKKIGFLGDSITVGAADQLHARFEPDQMVRVRAVVGGEIINSTYDGGILANSDPDRVVINLGTNEDENQPMVEVLAAYDNLLTLYAGKCIVTVTVNDLPEEPHRSRAQAINAHIHTTDTIVVDWAEAIRADPEQWFGPEVGVHPNAAGQALLVDLVDIALDQCPSPPE